ncbi:MAG TPA: hypothetical protein VEB20_12020 [Azospirillaceae bacterium]|nr:hypothetical protein [Azospirillaceae bacterium]
MNGFALALGAMIVLIALKPAVVRARQHIMQSKRGLLELKRRRVALSQQIRALARESLGQRLTADADDDESSEMTLRVAGLTRRVQELERVDRRILVLDERRGLSETGWIVLLRRSPEAPVPGYEPQRVTQLWHEGRYVFFYAGDMGRARRKALVRFPESAGYEVVDAFPHEGDLAEQPTFGAKKESA